MGQPLSCDKKALQMSVVIKMFNALDAHNLDAIADYLHEEFMYFSDYEVKNKEDWLQEMQSHFDTKESKFTLDRRILCEIKDCYASERVANISGQKSRTTFMALIIDDKLHCAMLQRVPID